MRYLFGFVNWHVIQNISPIYEKQEFSSLTSLLCNIQLWSFWWAKVAVNMLFHGLNQCIHLHIDHYIQYIETETSRPFKCWWVNSSKLKGRIRLKGQRHIFYKLGSEFILYSTLQKMFLKCFLRDNYISIHQFNRAVQPSIAFSSSSEEFPNGCQAKTETRMNLDVSLQDLRKCKTQSLWLF